MDTQKRVNESIEAVRTLTHKMSGAEHKLANDVEEWLVKLSEKLDTKPEGEELAALRADLASAVRALAPVEPAPLVNGVLGRALSLLIKCERMDKSGRTVMRRLVPPAVAERSEGRPKRVLVINPGSTSTKVGIFDGLTRLHDSEVHLNADYPDGAENRANGILDWMKEVGVELATLDGIAPRGGFIAPVPTGIYKVTPEMEADLAKPRLPHASNMGIAIAKRLAELSGHGDKMLLATRDAVVSDEMELIERVTGYVKIKRDGSGAHYLNHKAVWRMLASMLDMQPEALDCVTAHIGGGMSIALHRGGEIINLVDAFAGLASANRCGQLDLQRVMAAFRSNDISFKELEDALTKTGGLLSLAGTNDFKYIEDILTDGTATPLQREKISLILDFVARQLAAGILKLTADGKPVKIVALSGGLARSAEIVKRLHANLSGRLPLAIVPGSVEHESLAAGVLCGFFAPDMLKDYTHARESLAEKRANENTLLDATIVERKPVEKKGPIVNLQELVDAALVLVKKHEMPTIAVIGANSEHAIMAVKFANEAGPWPLARFVLLGDGAEIRHHAHACHLALDTDLVSLVDTTDPVGEGVKLIAEGKAHIVLKGLVQTADLLRGVLRHMKDSGKLQKGQVLSHVALIDLPRRRKLLAMTDAAVMTYPTVDQRVQMLENALKVVHNLNVAVPRVAVVSSVEQVNDKMISSVEAKEIADKFVGRADCLVEGPLSFDVAMDKDSAIEKKYKGQIKGDADVLLMPTIDAGNVLWKALTTQAGASVAGAVLCGPLPVALTSRGDSAQSKLASLALTIKLYYGLLGK